MEKLYPGKLSEKLCVAAEKHKHPRKLVYGCSPCSSEGK